MKIPDLAIALVIYLALSMVCGYVDGTLQQPPHSITASK